MYNLYSIMSITTVPIFTGEHHDFYPIWSHTISKEETIIKKSPAVKLQHFKE